MRWTCSFTCLQNTDKFKLVNSIVDGKMVNQFYSHFNKEGFSVHRYST